MSMKKIPFISKRKGLSEKQRSETKYDKGKLSLVDGKTETNKQANELVDDL